MAKKEEQKLTLYDNRVKKANYLYHSALNNSSQKILPLRSNTDFTIYHNNLRFTEIKQGEKNMNEK